MYHTENCVPVGFYLDVSQVRLNRAFVEFKFESIYQVGRMAGQFAKPRSDPFEEKNGKKLASYKGDNINGDAFDEKSRIPDPERMIRAYCQSSATLNLLRAFATGGYAAMQRVTQWNLDFAEHSEQGDRYKAKGLKTKFCTYVNILWNEIHWL